MDILELINTDFKKAIDQIILQKKDPKAVELGRKEYLGDRKIPTRNQVGFRQDKIVGKGEKSKIVPVAKIPFNYQKKIVRMAVSFLFGSPVKLTVQEEDSEAFLYLKKVWHKNRLDNLLKKFCEAVKSETEATLIFYIRKNEETKVIDLKVNLRTFENGTYYPVFDDFGDMVAFIWTFMSLDENGKEIPNAWIYTATEVQKKQSTSEGWVDAVPKEKHGFSKIPVVYMRQDSPEWNDVRHLIDRKEMSYSKFCDTNDYNSAPILKMIGEVNGMPDKEDQGKALRIPQVYEDGKLVKSGDVDYLTWDQSVASNELEFETANDLIHSQTDTPDLSFNNVKGVGNVSGIALELMFLGAILKAKYSEGDYSITIDRILNVMISGISTTVETKFAKAFEEMEISTEFTSVLPKNLAETVRMLSEAAGGKAIMSQSRAVNLNPLVQDPGSEITALEDEAKKDLGESFN